MRPLTIAACLALTLLAAPAMAQDPATAGTNDSSSAAERGFLLTYTCQGCHGIDGYKNAYPNYHVPKLGGQPAAYLSNALHAYRDGTRSHPTMQAQARGFSDQDIADITAFLSNLK
ncbi:MULTISPECIES: c-type cytochrome [unclassified Lysobacter]